MIPGALLLALLSLLRPAQQHQGGTPPPPAETPPPAAAQPTPEARAAWEAVVAAMTVPGQRQAVTSFELRAHVTARQGVQSNDFEAFYRFLEPAYIRFGLGASRETGRGLGKGQKAYWLKDGEQVTVLDGREYEADRKLVQRMTTIAKNMLALSDPSKIRTEALELRAAPPPGLPAKLARPRLTWIELVSPDFDLYRDEPPAQRDPALPRLFRVQVGTDRKTQLPSLVVLREEGRPAEVTGEPLLFELLDYRPVDGYLLPHGIRVWGVDTTVPAQPFQAAPGQEISVLYADLTPRLAPEDFQP